MQERANTFEQMSMDDKLAFLADCIKNDLLQYGEVQFANNQSYIIVDDRLIHWHITLMNKDDHSKDYQIILSGRGVYKRFNCTKNNQWEKNNFFIKKDVD